MKKLITTIGIVLLFFVVGCGVDSASDDTSTKENSRGTTITVSVDKRKVDNRYESMTQRNIQNIDKMEVYVYNDNYISQYGHYNIEKSGGVWKRKIDNLEVGKEYCFKVFAYTTIHEDEKEIRSYKKEFCQTIKENDKINIKLEQSPEPEAEVILFGIGEPIYSREGEIRSIRFPINSIFTSYSILDTDGNPIALFDADGNPITLLDAESCDLFNFTATDSVVTLTLNNESSCTETEFILRGVDENGLSQGRYFSTSDDNFPDIGNNDDNGENHPLEPTMISVKMKVELIEFSGFPTILVKNNVLIMDWRNVIDDELNYDYHAWVNSSKLTQPIVIFGQDENGKTDKRIIKIGGLPSPSYEVNFQVKEDDVVMSWAKYSIEMQPLNP